MNILPTLQKHNSSKASLDPKDPAQVLARRKSALAMSLSAAATDHITQCIARHKTVTDSVWENKNELAPQQAFDALGSDAARSCMLHAAFTEYLNKAELILGFSFGLKGPTSQIRLNEDGTVTVL